MGGCHAVEFTRLKHKPGIECLHECWPENHSEVEL